MLKDIQGALKGLRTEEKKTDPVPRLLKKALNRLSTDEKDEFERFLAVEHFGPRALFPYSSENGCSTDTFDKMMGSPKEPFRQDYVPSERALEDNTWEDNDIPVRLGKNTYCVTPSDKGTDGKNLAESQNPRAYHHMGELAKIDAKEKPSAAAGPFATARSTATWPSAPRPSRPRTSARAASRPSTP